MVLVNPHNPTGHVLSKKELESVAKLCYDNSIMLICDEVYQDNVYTPNRPFIAMRQVLADLALDVEIFSMHSASKGIMGEGGFRAGYYEVEHMDDFTNEMLYKLKSIELCANTLGQAVVDLMIDPPQEGRESAETVEKYLLERDQIEISL